MCVAVVVLLAVPLTLPPSFAYAVEVTVREYVSGET